MSAAAGRAIQSRRVLITGLSSELGGRLAQLLEREPELDAIVGVDAEDPRHELHRTEFVRVATNHGLLLARIIRAAAIDTVLDTRLLADPLQASLGRAREVNVADTRTLLEACGGADSPVRKVVFKSSVHYYGFDRKDPAFLSEEMERPGATRTQLEREIVAAEDAVAEFAARNREAVITVLRLANAIGSQTRTSHEALLSLPVVPTVLGFDPRMQFIHEDDIVGVLRHAVMASLPGVFNAAADGVLALSEVVSLLGKPTLPVLPPWGTWFTAAQLRRLGLRVPVELTRELVLGRGLDNRRLKAAGYAYRYTTREAVLKLRAQLRLRPLLQSGEAYRYDREVEEFLRWSPSVQSARSPATPGDGTGPPFSAYDGLAEGELIELLSSLEADSLERLRRYEAAHLARGRVLEALDRQLSRRASRR